MSICDQIRRTIAAEHAGIEQTPVAVAMLNGTIDRAIYASLLGQLWHVHAAFEQHLDRLAGFGLETSGFGRTKAIDADLAALGADAGPAGIEAEALADTLHAWADSPHRLLAAGYVFEGSRMGGLVLARPLAAALGVSGRPGSGLDYHLDGAADRPAAWRRFRAAVDALPLTDAARGEMADAAVELMSLLRALYAAAALEPVAA